MKKMNILIVSVVVLLLIISVWFLFFNNNDPCADIIDSSQRADCYIELAQITSNVEYCNVNYYTQKCLKEADPRHTADKEDVKELCEQVTDTSTRNDCLMYVENNY